MKDFKGFTKTPVALAVQSALLTTTIGMSSANAADEGLEEVIVTGSRIARSISDAPSPVTIISREDIQLSGIESLSEFIRSSSFNTLGSFRERSGSSFGQISTVDLRGLGAQYTAVLINGRRVPGNPLTGASIVDLNTIPLSAVDKIEILTDSASAVYGADAIGGVINITLLDDYEGFEVSVGVERPEREGADAQSFSFLGGNTFGNGNIVYGVDYFKRDGVFDKDRTYSAAQVNGPSFNDTVGVSVGGNTGFLTDFSEGFVIGDCGTDVYTGVLTDNPFANSGDVCGFPYANISLQTANIERSSLFLDGNYNFAGGVAGYMNARYSKAESSGRYAPAVGFFSVPGTAPSNPRPGTDIFAFHRFVGHGNRDDSYQTDEYDVVLGLKGEWDNGIGYDAFVRQYNYTSDNDGKNYVQTSVLEALAATGEYNVTDPFDQGATNQAAIEASRIELDRQLETDYTNIGFDLNGAFMEDKIGWAAGAEWASEEYQDIYDDFRESGDVLGSAGNSASGDRDRSALYGELKYDPIEQLSLNFAIRYDDYNDVGDEVSPQIALRYAPTDNLAFRASWGEGFKAPNLTDLYGLVAQSFEQVTDLARCAEQGIADADCPRVQVERLSGGNLDLIPESSESLNVGVIWDATDSFSVSLDWYSIEILDQISLIDDDDLLVLEQQNALPPGATVTRGAVGAGQTLGAIVQILNPIANTASVEVEGLDLRLNYQLDTDFADFVFGVSWSHLMTYDEVPRPGADTIEQLGTDGFPDNRAQVGIRAMLPSDWALNYTFNFTDSHEDASGSFEYDKYFTHDIVANYTSESYGEFTFGIRNIGNELVPVPGSGSVDDDIVNSLYDVYGRLPFFEYTYKF